jgi:hypothetical protein
MKRFSRLGFHSQILNVNFCVLLSLETAAMMAVV